MAVLAVFVAYLSLAATWNPIIGQSNDRRYLPSRGGRKPPSTNFNFLNIPPYQTQFPLSNGYYTPDLITYPRQYFKHQPQICSPPANVLSKNSWHPEKKDDLLYYPLVYSASDPLLVDTGYLEGRSHAQTQTQAHAQKAPFSCTPPMGNMKRRKECLASQLDSARLDSKFHYFDGCERHILDESCRFLEQNKLAVSCQLPDGGELQQYGVLSDNHTYILMYECWPNRKRKPVTWSLRSKSKIIPESLKYYILDYTSRFLGFDYHDYRQIDYSHCPDF